MLKIKTRNDNTEERSYVINTLFGEYLGLECNIEFTDEVENYEIILPNNNKLIIEDHFFSKYPVALSYLKKENVPLTVKSYKFDEELKDIIVLFGDEKNHYYPNKIVITNDVFASTFFMLTRWEEMVMLQRDKLGRFSAEYSLAFKNSFIDKPIVNEYVELIWKILLKLEFEGKRKVQMFKLTLTHDVDLPRMWWNFKDFSKTIISSIIKSKNLKYALELSKRYFRKEDPFNTFNYLMNLSESYNIKSHFFFMSGGTSNKDNFYKINHPIIIDLMKEIDRRGHVIGFHPSFNAYNDDLQFKKELSILQRYSPQKIKSGRQHFLRFDLPKTWQIWETNELEWDSTMSFFDQPGFRCGTCYEFPVFDILQRKQLNLREKPLIVMEGSFVTYQNLLPEEVKEKIFYLLEVVRKYEGEFVFLWHNSAFNTPQWKRFEYIYADIISNAMSKTNIV